jgi:predicted short-subunit dehydrogenase-like oxidoreductase (DUF2520 family)
MPLEETHHLLFRIAARHFVALLYQRRELLRVAFGLDQLDAVQRAGVCMSTHIAP